MASLAQITEYLDATLDIANVPDYPGALNGVQLANRGNIECVATAVDFSSASVEGAIDAGARLLVVHHGMFWGGAQPITSHRYERLRALIASDVAVYSAHLPLDRHPQLGNNALLAQRLGLVPSGGFARYQNIDVGLSGISDVPTARLAEIAGELAREFGGTLAATPFEPNRITRAWGICTGAGADSSSLREAAQRGIDTLIVGEGPHHTAVEARELGIVVLYAGHYATETLGVRALGDVLAARFNLTTAFIDAPTGL
ncbi:MAG TPA: Nif3-like dinuclear metal center hexameric protein [Gemmatimonadaceae bacterium]|nr:Nif3-like dinuclear metal center hexameric protein [Gemmatimonadaceae bacterium]